MELRIEMSHEERPKRFMDLVRERIRLRHLSYATEKHYVGWIHRFILFHGKRHPKDMGEEEIEQFLSHLAIKRDCAPGTQNPTISLRDRARASRTYDDFKSTIRPRNFNGLGAMQHLASRLCHKSSLFLKHKNPDRGDVLPARSALKRLTPLKNIDDFKSHVTLDLTAPSLRETSEEQLVFLRISQ